MQERKKQRARIAEEKERGDDPDDEDFILDENSGSDMNPDMEEDHEEEDIEDFYDDNNDRVKKKSTVPFKKVQEEIEQGNRLEPGRTKGFKKLKSTYKRLYIDYEHLKGAKDEDIDPKTIAQWDEDPGGYFQFVPDETGTHLLRKNESGLLEDGTGREYEIVQKSAPSKMKGGWSESQFAYSLPKAAAEKKDTTESGEGITVKFKRMKETT